MIMVEGNAYSWPFGNPRTRDISLVAPTIPPSLFFLGHLIVGLQ